MKKKIALTIAIIATAFSYGIVAAAPAPTSVIVVNAPTQPIPVTSPSPLNVKPIHPSFTLYDSGDVSDTNLDLELDASNCGSLLACVFNKSVGQPTFLSPWTWI